MKDKPEMVYKSTLRSEFGFTDKLIKMLGEPDSWTVNPHYKSGPMAALYRLDRAKQFKRKHRAMFQSVAKHHAARSAAARASVATRTEALCKEACSMLQIGRLPTSISELRAAASAHAYDRHDANAFEPGIGGLISTVRHEHTNYESVLATIKRRVGATAAYKDIRDALEGMIDEAMTEKYGPDWGE